MSQRPLDSTSRTPDAIAGPGRTFEPGQTATSAPIVEPAPIDELAPIEEPAPFGEPESTQVPDGPAFPRDASGRVSLLGLTAEGMRSASGPLAELPSFRAQQVARWIYGRGETRFEAMTDIGASLRRELTKHYAADPDPTVSLQRAEGNEAIKFLFRLGDGHRVEAVLINTGKRRTICISSQAGCAYACAFCATAAMGPGRNLSVREIVSQVLAVRRQMRDDQMEGGHNIVFMGMGEPLANLNALIPSLRLLQADEGLAIGRRRITVSTVGLPRQIIALADSDVKVRLAFSLHATTEEMRTRLMPINARHPFVEVFRALHHFQRTQRMRVTLEYLLLEGVNDTVDDARRLAGFAQKLRCKVNLIAFNPHPAAPFRPTGPDGTAAFLGAMHPVAPSVTLRYSKGREILAACGQLSTTWMEQDEGGALAGN
jgi:23S rRNA (adenine2503-C2)-methyltransferase